MSSLEELLGRMEELLAAVDELEQPAKDMVFEMLDGLDTLHRLALDRLAQGIDAEVLERLRAGEPAVAWLLDVYGIGVDQRAAADLALETVLPYVHSHGGRVEVLDVADGVVRLRMGGACSGCSASAVTITETIDQALREHVPGYSRVEVEEEPGPRHSPPGPVLVQIEPRPR